MNAPHPSAQLSDHAQQGAKCFENLVLLAISIRNTEDDFLQALAAGVHLQPQFWQVDEEICEEADPWEDGDTLAMKVSSRGWGRALGALIDAGAKPDFHVGAGSPMREAAAWGQRASLEFLLGRGAAIDGPPGQPVSPLGQAAMSGRVDCCLFLLEAGADPDRAGPWNQTPVFLARQKATPGSLQAAEAIEAWVQARDLRTCLGHLSNRPRSAGPKAL